MSIESLLQFVDEDALDLTQEQGEAFPRAILFQGNKTFEDEASLKGTVKHTGGIGFPLEDCPEIILQDKDGTICKTESGVEFKVFPHLDIVVLATSRIRRFYMLDEQGKTETTCGTNQDGLNASGWADGQPCQTCPLKQGVEIDAIKKHKDQKKCRGEIPVLIYIPKFDHTCIIILKGGSYMPASDMLKELNRAGREFAKRPEIQKASPNLKRVNSFFFNVRIKASEFKKTSFGTFINELAFTPFGKPINWDGITNAPGTITRAKDAMDTHSEQFKNSYVNDRDPNNKPIAALTGETQVQPVETKTTATVEEVDVKSGQVVSEPSVSTQAEAVSTDGPPPIASAMDELEAL